MQSRVGFDRLVSGEEASHRRYVLPTRLELVIHPPEQEVVGQLVQDKGQTDRSEVGRRGWEELCRKHKQDRHACDPCLPKRGREGASDLMHNTPDTPEVWRWTPSLPPALFLLANLSRPT